MSCAKQFYKLIKQSINLIALIMMMITMITEVMSTRYNIQFKWQMNKPVQPAPQSVMLTHCLLTVTGLNVPYSIHWVDKSIFKDDHMMW